MVIWAPHFSHICYVFLWLPTWITVALYSLVVQARNLEVILLYFLLILYLQSEKKSSFDWPLWCLCSLSTSAPGLSARASFGGFSSSSLLTRLPDSRLVCPIHSSFCLPEWALINAHLFRSYFYLKFFSRPIFSLE